MLDYLKCSEEERREYELYKESLHYQASMYESTYVICMLKGEHQGIKKVAKALKDKQVELAVIMETTGLTAQEIELL